MAFRSFRNALLCGAILVATVAVAAPASATVIVDFGFGTTGLHTTISYTPDGALGNAGVINGLGTIGGYNINTLGPDDTTGIVNSSTVNVAWNDPIPFVQGTQTLTSPVNETLVTSLGTYTAVFSTLFAQSVPNSTSLAWVLEGTLTLPNTTTQQIFLSAAFTNVSNSNAASTTVAFTETSTPPPVISTPEPASMAILGVGMVALGAARRRKS